jgi:hypothetical protein
MFMKERDKGYRKGSHQHQKKKKKKRGEMEGKNVS